MDAVILVGCSGSGKSTLAREYERQGYLRIERDILRRQLVAHKRNHVPLADTENLWAHWKFKWEDEVTAAWNKRLDYAAEAKKDIIISDTNLTQGKRFALKGRLEELGYTVEMKVIGFSLTLDELWKRDASRVDTVGHAIVAKQYKVFREQFPLHTVTDPFALPEVAIFDVDGTLAHHEGIRSPYDWHMVHLDKPDETVWAALISQKMLGREVIIFSGRDAVCRDLTTQWLNYHYNQTLVAMGFKLNSPLVDFKFSEKNVFMRPEGDQRSDVEIKNELFFAHIDGKFNTKVVFDDRPKVCRGWYELNLKVVHCANPYIEF